MDLDVLVVTVLIRADGENIGYRQTLLGNLCFGRCLAAKAWNFTRCGSENFT